MVSIIGKCYMNISSPILVVGRSPYTNNGSAVDVLFAGLLADAFVNQKLFDCKWIMRTSDFLA
jgi:hypothetical protein